MTFFILQIRNILKENLLEFFYKATVFQGYDGFGNRTVKCPLVVLHLMLLGYLMQASDIRCDAGMFCCANDCCIRLCTLNVPMPSPWTGPDHTY